MTATRALSPIPRRERTAWPLQDAPPSRTLFSWLAAPLLLGALFLALLTGTAHAGTLVKASCPCGFSKALSLFGGRRNFQTVCMFPALDKAKHDIALYNVFEYPDMETSSGPSGLISYASPRLMPAHPTEEVAFWHIQSLGKTLTLYKGGYICPRCGRRTLTFQSVGFWD